MINIDGSYLEGGGQILRTAIALSTITKQSVRILNIRKGREKPGLRPQHFHGITAAAQICSATVQGLKINSIEIIFSPGKIKGGTYTIDTKTAGSVTLILQTLIPIGIFSESALELIIKGGTAVPFSPTIEYFLHIVHHILKIMGVSIFSDIRRHGFYPRGGGEIFVEIKSGEIRNINLMERGALQKIDVVSIASNHLKDAKVADRMVNGFKKIFPDANTKIQYVHAFSPGCFIRSHAHFDNGKLGADALGKRGKRAEDVGKDAARALKKEIESNAPIDSWMVDQIIPYMALATIKTNAVSKVKIPCLTKHAQTNIWVTKKFLPVEFEIQNNIMICSKTS
ncbi:RNA 3'-terminal phosphate cyclase [candidate division WOR-3 bacterium]|nr:RNA 3'-terminal phosphate cyclase [candidate division WOR-3 bacterium]